MKSLPPGVGIATIREEDLASFRAAVGEVAAERRWLMTLEAFPEDATRAFVLGNLAKGFPSLVARHGDRVVGWCDIVPLSPFEGFRHNGRLGMGVVSGWRGKGIGGALLDAALAAAPAAGFTRVELEAYASNPAALALYRSRGFVTEGRKVGVRILDGHVDDLVCMAWRTA